MNKEQDKRDHFACMEREDEMCQKCGAQATQTHHAKRRYPSVRHDPRYHIALCFNCHQWAHMHPRSEQRWLESLGITRGEPNEPRNEREG